MNDERKFSENIKIEKGIGRQNFFLLLGSSSYNVNDE
jgi:hypothetical protein